MISNLYDRFKTAMMGYWLPTILTVLSLMTVFGGGFYVNKVFYWFGTFFGPAIVVMWIVVWRWEHPRPRYRGVDWPSK